MKIRNLPLIIVLCALLANVAYAQSEVPQSEPEFHTKIVKLYSFEPYKLSSEEIDSKSVELDGFWKEVEASPQRYLPFLRNELKKGEHFPFFYYDGSKLLLSISKERQDQELALRSIPKANLKSIQNTDYLRTVHWFAVNGFNTTEAALRILDFPDFKAPIVQHSMTLGQDYSLIFMLFPMPDTNFVGPLIGRLGNEKNVRSQKSILLALWYALDPDASKAISSFVEDSSKPQEAREFANLLMKRKASSPNAAKPSDILKLKKERQETIKAISDEALFEFDKITVKMLESQ